MREIKCSTCRLCVDAAPGGASCLFLRERAGIVVSPEDHGLAVGIELGRWRRRRTFGEAGLARACGIGLRRLARIEQGREIPTERIVREAVRVLRIEDRLPRYLRGLAGRPFAAEAIEEERSRVATARAVAALAASPGPEEASGRGRGLGALLGALWRSGARYLGAAVVAGAILGAIMGLGGCDPADEDLPPIVLRYGPPPFNPDKDIEGIGAAPVELEEVAGDVDEEGGESDGDGDGDELDGDPVWLDVGCDPDYEPTDAGLSRGIGICGGAICVGWFLVSPGGAFGAVPEEWAGACVSIEAICDATCERSYRPEDRTPFGPGGAGCVEACGIFWEHLEERFEP